MSKIQEWILKRPKLFAFRGQGKSLRINKPPIGGLGILDRRQKRRAPSKFTRPGIPIKIIR